MRYLASRYALVFLLSFGLSSCTVYTEKRSEALSQAVFATSDSIEFARFDLASKYSKEAEKLAFPPKNRIEINPIYTSDNITRNPSSSSVLIKVEDKLSSSKQIVSSSVSNTEEIPVLRLIIPEHLKHAKLLIENSNEWNHLLQTKEFSIKLQQDNSNLQKLSNKVNKELQRQTEMNSRMVSDLKDLQRKIAQKDLAILKRNIVIATLILAIGGGIYLRIKGIL
jgi:hypothetical protein